MEKSESVENLNQFVVDSVRQAYADDAPFHHLRFDRIFPDDFYAQMLEAMPVAEDYRAMSGKSKIGSGRPDGRPTRRRSTSFRNTFAIYRQKSAQSGMLQVASSVRKS